MRRPASSLLALVLLLAAWSPPLSPGPAPVAGGSEATGDVPADATPGGLVVVLADGTAADPSPPQARPSSAPLAADEAAALLSRAPSPEPAEATPAFSFPTGSRPVPRTGAIVEQPPLIPGTLAGSRPGSAEAQPLRVLRYAPEGEVPLTDHLSITFSQPMVPVGAVGELAERIPVTLEPAVDGRWRWAGTRTLVFEGSHRLPMATHFRVTVPAGTTSTVGGRLAGTVVLGTSTPAPRLVDHRPRGRSVPREPLVVLVFDQAVDPARVATVARLVQPGFFLDDEHPLRLASAGERAGDDELDGLIERHGAERVVALHPERPLPYDAELELQLPAGLTGSEGPRATEHEQVVEFAVHGPLELVDRNGTGGDPLAATWPLRLRFSNPLDPACLEDLEVDIEPAVPDVGLSISAETLTVSADWRGRTRRQLRLSPGLRDVFGQRLEGALELSLTIEPLRPSFRIEGGELQLLDPTATPYAAITAVNVDELDVSRARVAVDDWSRFAALRHGGGDADWLRERTARRSSLEPDAGLDAVVSLTVGLEDILHGGPGHVVLSVHSDDVDRDPRPVWLQRTDLGLHVAVDDQRLLAWVSDLASGAPREGVEVSLSGQPAAALTDADGLAFLPLPEPPVDRQFVVARHGDDSAILPESGWSWSRQRPSSWAREDVQPTTLAYVFDDRGTYKPGETLRVKGWLREVDLGLGGGTGALPPGRTLNWLLRDRRRIELASGSLEPDAWGAFDLAVPIPADVNLGTAQLRLALDEDPARRSRHSHSLEIAEYRLPEYEVAVESERGAVVVGEALSWTATARYYGGGGLPAAGVDWTVRALPASWSPPGWPGFRFGTGSGRHGHGGWGGHGGPWTWSGRTDATGRHVLSAALDAATAGAATLEGDGQGRSAGPDEPLPSVVTLTAEAAVTDVDRQRWAASASVLVHPAAVAVGLASERPFVDPGEPLPLRLVVTDLEGTSRADVPITLTAARSRWVRRDGSWIEEVVETLERTELSIDGVLSTAMVLEVGGRWNLRARVHDAAGRAHVSELTAWVSGGRHRASDRLTLQDVTLVPDREEYAVGDVARVLVVAPFADAHGVATLMRAGILEAVPFELDGTSHVLELPIEAGYAPSLDVSVELAGHAPRLGDDGAPREDVAARPAFARAQLRLSVPPEGQRLHLDVTPAAPFVEPGADTHVEVVVRDGEGRPVPGVQLAVAVVDEAVLALSGRELPDPVEVLHPTRFDRTYELRNRAWLRLADPELQVPDDFGAGSPPAEGEAAFLASGAAKSLRSLGYAGEDAAAAGPSAPAASARAFDDGDASRDRGGDSDPIRERARFDVLAAWRPTEVSDAAGRVHVDVELPDNVTRYRVLVVALDRSDRAGRGEAGFSARLPLVLRPALPRFLNVGDACELPVVVQNGGEAPAVVDVALTATGLSLEGPEGQRVELAPGERVELRWPARAEQPGQARVSVVASSDTGAADAVRRAFPIHTPAPVEAFATYGTLDADGVARQPVLAPSDALPGFGALTLSTSTTALSELADAVVYLGEGSYGCAEQRASRVLAATALGDALAALGDLDPEDLAAAVEEDIAHLTGLQNADGGFPLWRAGRDSSPFASVHVAHALVAAQEAGRAVDGEVLARSLAYVHDVGEHLRALRYPPSERSQRTVRAYGLWVEQRAGRDVADRALGLATGSDDDELSLDARAWLLPLLSDGRSARRAAAELRAAFDQRVVETAAAAHLASSVSLDEGHVVYASARRTDALFLDALLRSGDDDGLAVKLVRGLLGHRRAGRWRTTQECVFALLALGRYFGEREAVTPSLSVDSWLDGRLVASVAHRGREVDTRRVRLPLDLLGRDGPVDLHLASAGQGRLYYRIGMDYAPADALQPPTSQGFAVERSYEALGDPADVRRDDDGVWHLRAGAMLRVRVTLVAGSDRHHVALVDRLPAGLEILNPGLAVTGTVPADEQEVAPPDDFWHCWWWGRPWYEHTNLRDDRAEAFASHLPAGVHHYSYVARATIPGRYLAPAAGAEEMYAPETFGRSAVERVVVE